MRPVVLVALALAALTFSASPAPKSDADVKALLAKQTQELVDAITNGTPEVWDRYLDERATLTAEDGKVSAKPEIVKDIHPLASGVSGTIKVVDFQAFVHGSVAVTNYVDDEYEDYHGHKLHCQYRTTDAWKKTEHGWRLIAEQVLALKTDPPSINLPAAELTGYAGSYALTPEITYEIRLKNGALEGQRKGRDPEPLMVEAPDVLFVPGSPRYRKIFQRDEHGRITGFVERREAWDLPWTRKADAP